MSHVFEINVLKFAIFQKHLFDIWEIRRLWNQAHDNCIKAKKQPKNKSNPKRNNKIIAVNP